MEAPLAMVLVRRELVSSLRRPRSFLTLTLFVLAAIVAVYIVWPDDGRIHTGLGDTARSIAGLIVRVLFGACLLLVPAMAAGSIVIEREQDTFDLLRTTLIPTSGLLLGKLLNSTGFFALLMLAAAPVIGVTFFLIGLEWRELFQAMTLLVVSAMSCASMGILSSAFFRRSGPAIAGAYVGLLLLMYGGIVVSVVVGLVLQPLAAVFGASVRQILGQAMVVGSPYFALNLVFTDGLHWLPFVMSVAYQVLFSALALALSLQALWRPAAPPRSEAFKPIDDPVVLHERRTQFPYYLIDPLKRKDPIEDGRNAMLVKELRWGLLNRATLLVRVFYGAAVVYFTSGLTTVYLNNRFESMRSWIFLEIACTVAVAPAVLANTLTKEYEVGNMDMLRCTLLTPRNIMSGKLLAGAVSMVPLVLAAVLSGIPVVTQGQHELTLLGTGYLTLIVSTLVCLSLSLFASLLTTRSVTALITTYAFTLVVFVGTWFIPDLVNDGNGVTSSQWVEAFVSPLYLFRDMPVSRSDYALTYRLWGVNTAFYLIVSFVLLGLCIGGFQRFRYRDE